jgi:hypothetical protein
MIVMRYIFSFWLMSLAHSFAKDDPRFKFEDQFCCMKTLYDSAGLLQNERVQEMYLEGVIKHLKALQILLDDGDARALIGDPERLAGQQLQDRINTFSRGIRVILSEVEDPFGEVINVFNDKERAEVVRRWLDVLLSESKG